MDATKCKKNVSTLNGWHNRQCSRKIWKDGFCRQHHPDSIVERNRKADVITAKLFVCASCEWIFKQPNKSEDSFGCPKCSFGYYSAHYVYGNKAYRYAKTQEPWLRKKMANYETELQKEIEKGEQS